MKKHVSHMVLSFTLFFAISASSSAYARQPQSKPRNDDKRTERTASNYSTQKYYFTKNRLSKATLLKKLLKIPGVRNADINMSGSFINITFDPQQVPKDHLKKNLRQWGIPGDFSQPKGKQASRQQGLQSQSGNREQPPLKVRDSFY